MFILTLLFLHTAHPNPAGIQHSLIINKNNGLIFKQVNNVLIAENNFEFPLFLKYKFPQLNSSHLVSNCDLKAHNVKAIEDVRSKIYNDIFTNFDIFLGNTSDSSKVRDFAHSLVHNSRKRTKRAFRYLADGYLTLSGWSENKLKNLKVWSEDHFNQTNQRINKIGIMLEHEGKALSNLQRKLCKKLNVNPADHFELAASQTISKLALDLNTVQQGNLPLTVSKSFLRDFCITNFKQNRLSNFCLGNLRKLFDVTDSKMIFDKNKSEIVIELSVSVPSTPKVEYFVYKVDTIPIFLSANQYPKQASVPRLYLVVNNEKPKIEKLLLFKTSTCDNFQQFRVCRDRATPVESLCARQTWQDIPDPTLCDLTEIPTKTTCFSKRFGHSFVISTSKPVELHSTAINQLKVFKNEDLTIDKIGIINPKVDVSLSAICGRRTLTTRVRKTNFTHTFSITGYSEVNFTTETFDVKENFTIPTFKNLSVDTSGFREFHARNLPKIHLTLTSLVGAVGFLIFGLKVALVIFCCKKCKAKDLTREIHYN